MALLKGAPITEAERTRIRELIIHHDKPIGMKIRSVKIKSMARISQTVAMACKHVFVGVFFVFCFFVVVGFFNCE